MWQSRTVVLLQLMSRWISPDISPKSASVRFLSFWIGIFCTKLPMVSRLAPRPPLASSICRTRTLHNRWSYFHTNEYNFLALHTHNIPFNLSYEMLQESLFSFCCCVCWEYETVALCGLLLCMLSFVYPPNAFHFAVDPIVAMFY